MLSHACIQNVDRHGDRRLLATTTQPDAPVPVTPVTGVAASSGETAGDSPERSVQSVWRCHRYCCLKVVDQTAMSCSVAPSWSPVLAFKPKPDA